MYKIGTVAAGVVGTGGVGDCREGIPLTKTACSAFEMLLGNLEKRLGMESRSGVFLVGGSK